MPVNNELIESYLTNRLSATETAEFEALMAKDPLLKQEVTLQQDVIDSIQRIRKAELKARLNNIDVASSSLNLTSKIAASILISSLMGTGLFLYINSQEPTTVATNGNGSKPEVVFNHTEKSEKVAQNSNTETVVAPAQNAPDANAPVQHRNRRNTPQANNNVIAVAPSNNATEEMATPVRPDFENSYPSEEIDRGDNSSNQGANIGGNVQNANKVQPDAVENKGGKNGEYAYQYYSNKLYLYGFQSTSTYDIREFNRNGKKQVFMKINGMYFYLNNNQKEKTPMSPIQDKGLLEQLNTEFNK